MAHSPLWLPRGVRHKIKAKALLLSLRNQCSVECFPNKPMEGKVVGLFKTAGGLVLRRDCKLQLPAAVLLLFYFY